MSKLWPEYYAGQRIKYRYPYVMRGEILVGPNQSGVAFPEGDFKHNTDKPFEIHRMIPATTAFDGAQPANIIDNIDPLVLQERIRLGIKDQSKNQDLTKSPTLISQLVKQNARTWEWEAPYTLALQEGFQVTCSSDAYPIVCAPPPADPCAQPVNTQIANARVEITFEGFLLTIQPPEAGEPVNVNGTPLQGYVNNPYSY